MIARRRDGGGEQVAGRDRLADAFEMESVAQQLVERRGVEERAHRAAAEDSAERQVAQPPHAHAAERGKIRAEDMADRQARPELGELADRGCELAAARREKHSVDRSGRRAGDDRERRRASPQARSLADAAQDPGLIGSPGSARGQHQTEHRLSPDLHGQENAS